MHKIQKIRRFEPERDSTELYEMIGKRDLYDAFPGRLEAVNAQELQNILTERLEGYYHDLYVVEEDGTMCGFFLAYDYRVYDGHCRICGCIGDSVDCNLLKEFTDMLFEEYPLNKIFMEVTVDDWYMWRAAQEAGFASEALLKAKRYIRGEYYDVYIMSLYPNRK